MMTKGVKSTSAIRADSDSDLTALTVQLTGRVMVESPHTVLNERLLYGSQARLVFALLVLERDRPVSRDELADVLWPDGLPREGNLASAVSLAEYARSVAVRPFLPDAKGQWVDGVRDLLHEVLLWALCVLGEGHTEWGRPQLAVQAAEQAIVLEPFRERTRQLLMWAHAAAGNPAEALRVYDRCRRLLAEELDVCPAAESPNEPARSASAKRSAPPAVTIPSIVISFAISLAIGLIAGGYPANRAARLCPIEALRYE